MFDKIESEKTITYNGTSVLVFGYAAGGVEYPMGDARMMHDIYDWPRDQG